MGGRWEGGRRRGGREVGGRWEGGKGRQRVWCSGCGTLAAAHI